MKDIQIRLAGRGNQDSGRFDFIDAARGIGILFVVLGHAIIYYSDFLVLQRYLYAFHMPLFFIISGFLYNRKKYEEISISSFIKARLKAYILPYFVLAGGSFLVYGVLLMGKQQGFFSYEHLMTLGHYAWGILSSDVINMPNCGPLWFLTCIFVASVLFHLIMRFCRRPVIPVLLLAAVSAAMSYLSAPRIFWNIPVAFMAVLFLYLGFKIREFDLLNKGNPLILLFLAAIGSAAALLNHTDKKEMVYFSGNNYIYLSLMLLAAVSLSFVLLAITYRLPFLQNKFFRFMGKNTIIIFGIDYYVRLVLWESWYMVPILRGFKLPLILFYIGEIILLSLIVLIWNKIKKKVKRNKIEKV